MTVRFGDFRLDSETRELHRGRTALHLSPKAFDLLVVLIEERPRVVSKDVLRQRLWGPTTVLDVNLNNLASEIRAALDDDPQQPRFVRTAHRVGYAFCGTASSEPLGPGHDEAWCFLVWHERPLPVAGPHVVIGRDPTCEIWLDAPGVSRRHAAIRRIAGAATPSAELEDLGSTNGTVVDGRAVSSPVTLADGQAIRIGEAALTFRTRVSIESPTKRIRRPDKRR